MVRPEQQHSYLNHGCEQAMQAPLLSSNKGKAPMRARPLGPIYGPDIDLL